MHAAPDVFRPDGNKRHNVGDEAHLEDCAYIVHLPAKAVQRWRWRGIVILPLRTGYAASSEATEGMRWFGGPGRS